MNTTLVVATHNPGKAREFAKLLSGLPLEVVGLDAFPSAPVPEETGTTFTENALLKARDAFATTGGHRSVADDSGLAVDALDGAPGVYSARYAGEPADDAANLAKLLDELRGLPPERRTARFVCVLALVGPEGETTFTGTCEGTLLDAPRGTGGFGYDPIFVPTGHDRTFAEMTAEEKAALSHRGTAVRKLRTFLETNFRA